MTELRCVDLFAGAGGLSRGFQDAGFTISAAVDSVSVFCRTHQRNFPETRTIMADLSDFPPQSFQEETGLRPGDVDVIIGGPPCQGFSSIGVSKIRSLSNTADLQRDPRNYLHRQYLTYVDYYRPSALMMENVPTMATKYKGELFQGILELVASLGYTPYAKILNSVEFGVPQTRRRLFVIGTRNGASFSFPDATHQMVCDDKMQPDLLEGVYQDHLTKAATTYDAIGDLPMITDGCRADCLPYSENIQLTEYQLQMRNGDGRVRNNICRMSNERAKRIFSFMEQGQKYMDLPAEIRRILPFREDIFRDRLKRLDMTKPSWTILAHIGMDGYMYIHPIYDRTLSVREAARVQGFHDSFVFAGNMREQYIQVGNAVPPLLAARVADSVKKAIA